MASILGRSAGIRYQRLALWNTKRWYKTSVQSIRKGQVVQYKDKAWRVLARDHSAAGRGGAVVKIELQDILTKAKVNERFKSGDSLEILTMQDETYQYLYSDGESIHLLNPETFEEIEMPFSACEGGVEATTMLEDGMNVSVSFLTTSESGRQPVMFKLPASHVYTIASVAERAGQAAKGTVFKTATLENGAKLQVPEFVNAGDRVIVDIESMEYVKRAL